MASGLNTATDIKYRTRKAIEAKVKVQTNKWPDSNSRELSRLMDSNLIRAASSVETTKQKPLRQLGVLCL